MAAALSVSEAAVLGAVARHGRTHGFALVPDLRPGGAIGRIAAVKPAMVYALLHKLEARGLLLGRTQAQDDRPSRYEVRLSAAGRAALEAWVTEPVARTRELRQAFLLKLFLAPAAHVDVDALLLAQRTNLEEERRRVEAEADDAAARYRAAIVDASLNWLARERGR